MVDRVLMNLQHRPFVDSTSKNYNLLHACFNLTRALSKVFQYESGYIAYLNIGIRILQKGLQ